MNTTRELPPGKILPSPSRAERRHEERHDEFRPSGRVGVDENGVDHDRLAVLRQRKIHEAACEEG